jgi:hypothetical protein|tara:strand:- start:5373 stop:5585 length:213 start_codon:yes stop_codon:yes gene_type:complete
MLCNAANGFSSLFFAARQAKETRLGGKRVGFLLCFNKQQLFDDDDDNEEEEEVELVLGDNNNKECALMRV